MLRSCSCVMSATYAKTTENVTANTPDTEITAKYHLKQKQRTRLQYASMSRPLFPSKFVPVLFSMHGTKVPFTNTLDERLQLSNNEYNTKPQMIFYLTCRMKKRKLDNWYKKD